jgi:DNA-binding NarL/FixJ family response regulator
LGLYLNQKLEPDIPIHVALVEDDRLINDLVCNLLKNQLGIKLVASFQNAETFLAEILTLNVQVAILDIGMPGIGGIACVKKAKLLRPEVEYIMFTQSILKEDIFTALQSGATGYVSKNVPIEELISSIKEVNSGGSPMSREIARLVVSSFHRLEIVHPEMNQLTAQEIEVLQALDKGYAYKQIAHQMGLSENTIKTHVRHIYEKLQVHSRTEALNKIFKSK